MPSKLRPPKYCRQKERNRPDRAFVKIAGKKIQLGEYGTPESYQRYADILAGKDSEPAPAAEPAPAPTAPTIERLMAGYLEYAIQQHGSEKASEVTHTRGAFRILRRTHGNILAKDFGPKAYKAMRLEFIQAGWSRRYATDQCSRVKRMFQWGVEEELLPGDAYHRLAAVRPLKRGEHGARETAPVKPVDQEHIDATLPFMPQERADQVRLLLLTGMRPNELVQLSVEHIDRSGDVWTYRPPKHKTEHHGKQRIIAIGPKAQEILTPYLFRSPCFTGKRDAIRTAVRRAAAKAGVPHWWPYRCRHNAGTAARAAGGLDTAQALLGHSKSSTTEIYAELSTAKAIEVVRAIG